MCMKFYSLFFLGGNRCSATGVRLDCGFEDLAIAVRFPAFANVSLITTPQTVSGFHTSSYSVVAGDSGSGIQRRILVAYLHLESRLKVYWAAP